MLFKEEQTLTAIRNRLHATERGADKHVRSTKGVMQDTNMRNKIVFYKIYKKKEKKETNL